MSLRGFWEGKRFHETKQRLGDTSVYKISLFPNLFWDKFPTVLGILGKFPKFPTLLIALWDTLPEVIISPPLHILRSDAAVTKRNASSRSFFSGITDARLKLCPNT
jgi:hypothetical protein